MVRVLVRCVILLIVGLAAAQAAPRICVSNDTLLFGNRAVGTTTHAVSSVSNCGDSAWSFTSVSIHPATSSEFSVDATCATGLTLNPGDSCRLDVAFIPVAAGQVSGAVWLHNTTSTPDQLVTFYARGVDAQAGMATLAFVPAAVDFGSVAVGAQAGPLALTLRNTGSANLVPSALVLNGPAAYDFQTVSYGDAGDCALGSAIPPNGSCRVNIFFRPQAGGARPANLVIDAPQLSSLAIAQISGFGTTVPAPGLLDVIEFHHDASGQYFLTADQAEAAALDAGMPSGWKRTGAHFHAWARDAVTIAIDVPVCRFFGVPGVGPDSHFYTASASECGSVRNDPHWIDEGIAFRAALLSGNGCPIGYAVVTRLWWPGGDVTQTRHRYVVDPGLIEPMRSAGWVVEGPVFCASP